MSYTIGIKNYIDEEIGILQSLNLEEINNVIHLLETARKDGRRIYICGNGGSAATASHYVGDFNKGVSMGLNKRYRFESLGDNIPTMMAIANDISYDDIFVEPLKNKMDKGDIVIGISGSGNSENVVRAIEYANNYGGLTIGIVGYDGGRVKKLAQHSIHVNIDNMQIVEDVHMILDHVMMYVLCHQENVCGG